MNPFRSRLSFVFWLIVAMTWSPLLRSQEAPPPPAPAVIEEKPAEPVPAPESPAAAPDGESAEAAEPALRELGATEAKPVEPEVQAPETPTPAAKSKKVRRSSHQDGPPFGSHHVPAGVKQGEAVSLFGDSTIDGEVSGAAVSILGNTTVNGKVGGEAVSILGTTTVNGHVAGEAVAVLGDIVLGPDAVVDGEVVAVLGKVVRNDTTVVRGGVQQIGGFGPFGGVEWLRAYVAKCVLWGRPLWIGENLGWAWAVAGCFLLFYLLLALMFPRAVEKTAEVLEERPGGTLLASLLTVLLSPILMVLLILTGIGLVFVPFLAIGLFFASLFGKVAVLAWFGRRIGRVFGGTSPVPVVLAVLLGGGVVTLFYMIPFMGYLLYKLFGVIGTGMVVFRLALATQREKPAHSVGTATAASAAASMPPPAAAYAGNAFTAPVDPVVPPVAPMSETGASFVPPVAPVATLSPLSAMTLPRAGFWIRLAASALDAILVGIAFGFVNQIPLLGRLFGDFYLLWFAIYCVAMWTWKGTTVGGVICGLRVVRLDDRPIEWGVATVRALAGFLSAAVAGLGFIWVAFDDDKQSWHDKIAGTTVVRVPRGTPLL